MARTTIKDKRKAQLVAAALESIAKRGLGETTITHISKGAGMSRGIINFYFTTKEMMLRETLKTLIEEYEMEWRTALAKAGDDGRARMEALLAVHFGKKLCSARRLNVMSAFWGHAATQSAYRHPLEAADGKIEHVLTEVLAQLLGNSLTEARDAATQLHALIRGLWLNFMLNPRDAAREELAAHAARYIDRLTGAPVRIVRDHIIARPPATMAETTPGSFAAPKVKAPRKTKEAPQKQLDIEDLFGNR